MAINKLELNGQFYDLCETYALASGTSPGLMSGDDKSKLDFLDSQAVRLFSNYIDLTDQYNYDENTFYIFREEPYKMKLNDYNHIIVSSEFTRSGHPSWATHSTGFYCFLDCFMIGSAYGVTNSNIFIKGKDSRYIAGPFPINVTQDRGISSIILFLRGGGKYLVQTDISTSWTKLDSPYNAVNGEIFTEYTIENPRGQEYNANLYGTISNAIMDAQNNVINETYATKIEVSAHSIKTIIGEPTAEAFDNSLETLYSTLGDNSICEFMLNINITDYPGLGGGAWYCTMHRGNNLYGYIEAKKYGSTEDNRMAYRSRSKVKGTWGNWVNMMPS